MVLRHSFGRYLASAAALLFLFAIAPCAQAQWSQGPVTLENIMFSELYTTTAQTSGWSVCAYQNIGNFGCSISGDVTTTFVQTGWGLFTVEKKANNTAYAQMGNGYARATGDSSHIAEWWIQIPFPVPTPTFDYTYGIYDTTTVTIHVEAHIQAINAAAASTGWITGS